jgi:alcohol dehydrogenase (cytochrome c)
VTLSSGQKIDGTVTRIDDFNIWLTTAGSYRVFDRDGRPQIDIHDPLVPHRDLLLKYTDKDIHDVTFTLDRTTGEHLATGKLSKYVNWAKPELDKNGTPIHDPEKDYAHGSVLVNGSVTNFPPPAYSSDNGLMYIPTSDNHHMVYLTKNLHGAMGLGGIQEVPVASFGSYITAMGYKTGKIAWQYRYPTVSVAQGGGGLSSMLTTAGKLLFAGDPSVNFVAYSPVDGTPLWHARVGVSY